MVDPIAAETSSRPCNGASFFVNDSPFKPALARVESLRARESGPGQNPPTPYWPGLSFADIEPTVVRRLPHVHSAILRDYSGNRHLRSSAAPDCCLSDSAWTSRSKASISEEAERGDKRMPPGGLLPGGQSSDRKARHAGVKANQPDRVMCIRANC